LPEISTPYDDLIPSVEDPSSRFYLDAIRLYLALCAATISLEDAKRVVEHLKENPEFAKSPTDPTVVPVNEHFMNKIIDNLKTLKKYNLHTSDSIKSAFSFAFLNDESPLHDKDFQVLSCLTDSPLATVNAIARTLGFAPKTVSTSLARLKEQHAVRFSCLSDNTAFGIQSVIVFFKLVEGIEWATVETGLAEFPFTRSILKTAVSDLGYVSLMFPGGEEELSVLRSSASRLAGKVFDYVSCHVQTSMGAESNLSLYNNGAWSLPESIRRPADVSTVEETKLPLHSLSCAGRRKEFQRIDFAVASELRIDCRAAPETITQSLRIKGWDVDPGQITSSTHRLIERRVILPYTVLSGIGLSANFCFEVVCKPDWTERILSLMPLVPAALYVVSPRGLTFWIQVPSQHQVEYYQFFRSFERMPGVDSVLPIMTLVQIGSRSQLDLARHWKAEKDFWYVEPENLDLASYLT
jgi:DNA-binding Lrp family transcriptional regulator